MRELRRLALHIVLLVAASVLAYAKSQPEDEADRPLSPGEIELWGGKGADVARVSYKGKRKTVTLVANKDDVGAWYAGSVEPSTEPVPDNPDAGPHAPKPEEAATFIAVSVAEKLMAGIAPMRAKRAIGEVGDDRAEAFGLHEPDGTLTIEIGDKKHELVVGAATMGSGDRYVRYAKDNLVYVIDAAVVRDLEGGAGRLAERQQHEWKMADVERASVVAGEEKRDLLRSGTEGRRFWAGADTPEANDETAANWLKKVERLRPIKFVDKLPDGATKVVRVDFSGASKGLGFLELYRVAGDKTEYYVMSEYLRMPSTVASTIGEQVEDDIGSVFGRSTKSGGNEGEETPEDAPPEDAPQPPDAPENPHGNPHGD